MYNDTYGHQEGDNCLKQVAGVLDNNTKLPHDLVARYGGEEFSVVLPGTHAEEAYSLADVMCTGVRSLDIEHSSSDAARVITISLGVATFVPNRKLSPQKLIHAVDQALYQAKEKGRNQVKAHA